MASQYECETCNDKDDCDEYSSQAVRDISIRCGLCCHSNFQSERKKVLDELIWWLNEREAKRLQDSIGRNEDHEFINELYAHRDIDLTFRKKIEELHKDGEK
jgi:hypothetical protein